MLYGGLRIGLYDPVKRAFMGPGAGAADVPGLHIKIAAGMTTGALAILVASPTDLVRAGHPGLAVFSLPVPPRRTVRGTASDTLSQDADECRRPSRRLTRAAPVVICTLTNLIGWL